MNEEILNKVDEIIDYIKTSDLYQKYLVIEKSMTNNEDINKLIKEIKILQKKAVREEQQNNISKVKEIDKIISDKLTKLNNIPLYNEYNIVVDELNDIFLNIKKTIQTYINTKTS